MIKNETIKNTLLKITKHTKVIPMKVIVILSGVMMLVVGIGTFLLNYGVNAKSDAIKQMALMYEDLSGIVKCILPYSFLRWGLFLFVILLLIAKLFDYYYSNNMNVLHIIEHSSMFHYQFELKNEILEEIVKHEVHLTEQMSQIKSNYDKISYVVSEQDKIIRESISSGNGIGKLGYMGIAHTPLIMRAGFQVGQGCSVVLFHKKRNESQFERLKDEIFSTVLNVVKKNIISGNKELIVAVSTTSEIRDYEMDALKPNEKSIIKYQASVLDNDIVISKKQISSYVSQILSEVRLAVKDNDIEKVHFVVSSSVAFTFALGQAINRHSDTEVIIYHYDPKCQNKYPWGVSIMKDADDCIVIT